MPGCVVEDTRDMAVRASLVPTGPRMSMRQPLMIETYTHRGMRCVKRSDHAHGSVGVSFLGWTALYGKQTRRRSMFVLPTELPCIGCDMRLNNIIAVLSGASVLFFASRSGIMDENFFASIGWGNTECQSNEDDKEEEETESSHTRDPEANRRASPSSVEEVWEEAWRPLRESQYDASPCSKSDLVDKKPCVWVDAVADEEVIALLNITLSYIEEHVRGIGSLDVGMNGGKEMIEGLLWRAAKASASMWLGYVPSMLQSITALKRAREDGGYQIIRFDKKIAMYYSVLRLMTSTGIDRSLKDQSPEMQDVSQAGLIETSLSLRSWQLTPKQNTMDDASTQQLQRKTPSVVGSELLSVAPTVLQDMAVTVADIVCAAYINDVVKGSPSFIPSSSNSSTDEDEDEDEETNQYPVLLEMSLWPSLLHSRMTSTRDIQNFTNSLYLYRFLDEYIYQVAAIYEDRLPVYMLQVGDDASATIHTTNIQMRRATELAQLTGVKYAISLVIEALDFIRPIMHKAFAWFRSSFAWVLRSVIGNAIGLVLEGMQQSSLTKKNARAKKKNRSSNRTDINIIKPA